MGVLNNKQRSIPNFSFKGKKAFKNFGDDENIVITKADKDNNF